MLLFANVSTYMYVAKTVTLKVETLNKTITIQSQNLKVESVYL